MADVVKRARLDGDKEIYFAELLGINIADAHKTVNEVLRSSGMPTWRIATDIPMTTWIVLNHESKLQLFNDPCCAESAVSYVDNAPQTMHALQNNILALLNKIGVMTVYQWHAMPEERQSQLPSDVLFLLRNRIQERMEREWKWSKFLETVKTLADGTEQVEFRKLTHHHHFNYRGKETVILGEDRMKHIELVVSNIKALQEAKEEAKENHPIYCVVAAPRQGKSLLLDVLCSSIRCTGTLAVSITYNSATAYTEKDSSLLTCAPRFWARVVYTIANAFGANLGWLSFQNSSFISLLTLDRVLELVKMCLPQYSTKGIVVAADEFSELVKCLRSNSELQDVPLILSSITKPIYTHPCSALIVSGFVVKDPELLMTASSRPLTMLWLNPAVQSTREQYYPILEELKKRYPEAGTFPFALYEWIKFSPGLLGLWLEKLNATTPIVSIAQLNPPVVRTLAMKLGEEPSFFAEYWKECFDLMTENLLGLKCLRKYEQFYSLIHLVPPDNQHLLGFLNPFLVIHESIRVNYSVAERNVFQKLESAFTTVPWDAHAKGDALEMLVVSALQLRQIHTHSSSFSFSEVLSALCGVLHYHSHLSSLTISTMGVKFRSTLATGVESFPCHDSSCVNKGDAKPTRNTFCYDKERKEARRIAAIGAIKSHGIIHPTSVMNKGCDIILVLNFEDKSKGCALIIFEAKYFSSTTFLDESTPSTKARMVLEGLLKNPNPLEGCNVSHVCFTLCVTNGANVTYDVASLDQCIKDLKDQGISVSLHSVSTKEQWMSLLSPTLYFALPDIDEHTNFTKPINNSQRIQ
eukprot:Em0006g1006a